MSKETSGLTVKQQRFVEEYIKDSNATQAAIRTGYSEKTAQVQGSRLLSDDRVAAAIETLRAPIREAAGLTLESHLKTLEELREEARREKQFPAAISAEVNRGKAAGLYTEKHELTGANGEPLRPQEPQIVFFGGQEFDINRPVRLKVKESDLGRRRN